MGVSAFLHGPGAPVDVTVVTGSDRLLVAQVVASLRQALGDQRLRSTVLVDQMLHADLPVDIESLTAPPPDPAEPQERCASCTGTGGDDGRWHRWTRDRPLDGDRLGSLLQGGGWRQLLRPKGWLWLASDPAVAFGWSQAGPTVSLTPQQPWDPLPRHLGVPSYAPWTPPSTELVREPDPVRRPLPGQRLALYTDAATHRHLVGGLDACLVD